MKDPTILAIDIKNEIIEALQDTLFWYGYDDWWEDIRLKHQHIIENKITDVIRDTLSNNAQSQ